MIISDNLFLTCPVPRINSSRPYPTWNSSMIWPWVDPACASRWGHPNGPLGNSLEFGNWRTPRRHCDWSISVESNYLFLAKILQNLQRICKLLSLVPYQSTMYNIQSGADTKRFSVAALGLDTQLYLKTGKSVRPELMCLLLMQCLEGESCWNNPGGDVVIRIFVCNATWKKRTRHFKSCQMLFELWKSTVIDSKSWRLGTGQLAIDL